MSYEESIMSDNNCSPYAFLVKFSEGSKIFNKPQHMPSVTKYHQLSQNYSAQPKQHLKHASFNIIKSPSGKELWQRKAEGVPKHVFTLY